MNVTPSVVAGMLIAAPIYTKNATVVARQTAGREDITTTLADGTRETENTAAAGDWIVTNPGGEQYCMDDAKFRLRYRHLGGDKYQAVGKIRAIPNPYGVPVTLPTSWGMQNGASDCTFAVTLDEPLSPYIIGAAEFASTYR